MQRNQVKMRSTIDQYRYHASARILLRISVNLDLSMVDFRRGRYRELKGNKAEAAGNVWKHGLMNHQSR